MSKLPLFLIILVTIVSSAIFVYFLNPPKKAEYTPGIYNEEDTAVNQSKVLYDQRKAAGIDFKDGPCLSNAIIQGWVLDIAHNPRQPVDDLPENQCSSFREGSAKHFVELDPGGKVIRVE